MWYYRGMSREVVAIDFGAYTITQTAGDLYSFADSGHPTSLPSGAKCFKGRIEGGSIRIRCDGTAASTTVGDRVDDGEDILLSDSLLHQASFSAVAQNVAINGHFYNVEASVFLGGA